MKRIIFSLVLVALMSTVYAQQVVSLSGSTSAFADSPPSFNWSQTTHDFGKIKLNTPVLHEFTFVNNGGSPLIISSVQASCGCTVTEYSKDVVPAGAEGFVKATYNAAKPGIFTKTVTVNANTEEGVVVLTIRGEVVE